jgi:hypothetical protein
VRAVQVELLTQVHQVLTQFYPQLHQQAVVAVVVLTAHQVGTALQVVLVVVQVIHLLDHLELLEQEILLQLLLRKETAVGQRLVMIKAWAAAVAHLQQDKQEQLAHKAQVALVQQTHIQVHQ